MRISDHVSACAERRRARGLHDLHVSPTLLFDITYILYILVNANLVLDDSLVFIPWFQSSLTLDLSFSLPLQTYCVSSDVLEHYNGMACATSLTNEAVGQCSVPWHESPSASLGQNCLARMRKLLGTSSEYMSAYKSRNV